MAGLQTERFQSARDPIKLPGFGGAAFIIGETPSEGSSLISDNGY